MLAASALFIVVCFLGPITWIGGLILLAVLAHDPYRSVPRGARACRGWRQTTSTLGDTHMPWPKVWLFSDCRADRPAAGRASSGRRCSHSGRGLRGQRSCHWPDIDRQSARRCPNLQRLSSRRCVVRRRVALGNVIGSNLFNLLGIIGVTAMIGPIPGGPVLRTL